MITLNKNETENLIRLLSLAIECMDIQNSGVKHGDGFTLDVLEIEKLKKDIEIKAKL